MMHRVVQVMPCVLLLSFVPSQLRAQSPADSVRSLDNAWARAYATHDTSLAKALFADDLVVTGLNGVLKYKAGELADIRPQPNLHMVFFRTRDVVVRVYGGSAVATGLAEWRFTPWQAFQDGVAALSQPQAA